MNQLMMLVGLSGCGKSTFANTFANRMTEARVFSSDAIRKELYGDESIQTDHQLVFNLLHKRIKEYLSSGDGLLAIYDATNLNRDRRRAFLNELKNSRINVYKTCVVFATPVQMCIEHDAGRERTVGKEVIYKQARNFHVPMYCEGWNNIMLKRVEYTNQIAVKEYMDTFFNMDQQNPHHTLTLGKHCAGAYFYAEEEIKNKYLSTNLDLPHVKVDESQKRKETQILIAAYYHDIGKIFTKTLEKKDGQDIAHYYGHENYGAYLFLCGNWDYDGLQDEDLLWIATYINLHMIPYACHENEQELAKWYDKRQIPLLTRLIVDILHKADKKAH